MNQLSFLSVKKSSFSASAALVIALSLIFLQVGFTYYLSFQILALLTISVLILSSANAIKNEKHYFLAFLLFSLSVFITAIVSPAVISRNSSNIFITATGILAYAAMIGCLPNLKIKRPGPVLHILKNASSATVVVLAGLIILSESGLIDLLTRESLLSQNSGLIDNFTDADALSVEMASLFLAGGAPRIDLFYGEPSYLAIVLFTCLGCFMLSSKLLANIRNVNEYDSFKLGLKFHMVVMLVGVMSLLYLESLSSIIYAFIIVYFAFIKHRVGRTSLLVRTLLLAVIAAAFSIFSYSYFLHRITDTNSLSLIQRFGFLVDIGLGDLVLGIKDESKLPDVGVHNGLFYIIAISGFGGLLYLASLLYSVYTLSRPTRWSLFPVLLVLAIIMQNGGIFSPNKVVLFSLVLLPLACARTLYPRQCPAAINGRRYG